MNILYLDLFAGISGDMTLGAFIDLGVDEKKLLDGFDKLNLKENFEVKINRVIKNGISGTKVDILLDDHHSHEHEHEHSHHGHSHAHRNLYDIESIIDESSLEENVKELSKKIFRHVAIAESKVHDEPLDRIHFHEVGATDSILDIVGCAICINELKVEKIISSPLHVGTGFVDCQHGTIPVPVPATLEILKDGKIPTYSKGIQKELVTPTGAAIVRELVDEFKYLENVSIERVGYGAGMRDLEIPNMVRMILGKKK